MKSLPSTSSVSTKSMAAGHDVSLSHTMDDDITFERVRHMPRRTQFVSTHRKLSWQYDKQMKQHERDERMSHGEMARARLAMAEKLTRLQDAKKEVERRKSDVSVVPDRRFSAPSCLAVVQRPHPTTHPSPKGAASAAAIKHSHSASSFPLAARIPEDTAETARSPDKDISFTQLPELQHGKSGRRATVVEGVVESSGLPPHLIRRLSEFMDSTSAMLVHASGTSRRKDSPSSKDSSVTKNSPEDSPSPKHSPVTKDSPEDSPSGKKSPSVATSARSFDSRPLLSGLPERGETQPELA